MRKADKKRPRVIKGTRHLLFENTRCQEQCVFKKAHQFMTKKDRARFETSILISI